jgi:hypothetical protein
MDALAGIQQDFTAALLDPEAPLPAAVRAGLSARTQRGFAVYRNNVATSLIEAVALRYPVVRRLTGDDAFRGVAHQFVRSEPPRSPVLLHYGEAFPRFLRSLGPEPSIAYVADIAELEMQRGRAYHAADAEPVGHEAFASLSPEQLKSLRVSLHPSVALVRSRFPIVTIWRANQRDDGGPCIRQWAAESALVARPFLDVEVWRLPPGGFAFVDALTNRETLAAAAEAGMAEALEFDIAANLALLIEVNIVVGIEATAPDAED